MNSIGIKQNICFGIDIKNGDFVEYTFHPRALDAKIFSGEYHNAIYNEGQSELKINGDGAFSLSPFNYLKDYIDKNGAVIDQDLKE